MSAPTVVVRGSLDPIVPQRWAEAAARLLPHGRLVVIPGATHTANFQAPAELSSITAAFADACHTERLQP